MIFIVKDEHDETRDKVCSKFAVIHPVLTHVLQTIAKHVLNVHMNRPNHLTDENGEGELPLDKMKRYIAYCKQ